MIVGVLPLSEGFGLSVRLDAQLALLNVLLF